MSFISLSHFHFKECILTILHIKLLILTILHIKLLILTILHIKLIILVSDEDKGKILSIPSQFKQFLINNIFLICNICFTGKFRMKHSHITNILIQNELNRKTFLQNYCRPPKASVLVLKLNVRSQPHIATSPNNYDQLFATLFLQKQQNLM